MGPIPMGGQDKQLVLVKYPIPVSTGMGFLLFCVNFGHVTTT